MHAFLAYIAICIQKANKTNCAEYTTVRGLCFTLTQNPKFKRADLENLKAGIIELKDSLNLPISPIKNDYIVDYSAIPHTNFLCSIPTHLIRKIIAGSFTAHKCRLLRYTVVLLSTFLPTHYKDLSAKIGEVSINELANMTKTTTRNVQKFNKELIELKIINTYNRYLRFDVDMNTRDLYALYEETDQLEEYAKRKYADKYVPRQEADKSRKLLQMYYAVKNGTEYDQDTMRFLYEYIKKQNTLHKSRYYNRDLYWSYRRSEISKVKSLKPFTRYKYLKQKEKNT